MAGSSAETQSPEPPRQRKSMKLRADAERNVEMIRAAALEIFRAQGLSAPLEDVAQAAAVSKGTIYHRFGGRQGLIDSVLHELIADCFASVLARLETVSDPAARLDQYLLGLWMLQFDQPAANDVLVRALPESQQLCSLCDEARRIAAELLDQAQSAGGVCQDLTADDIGMLIWERGVIARASTGQNRSEYRRRLDFVLRALHV